MSRISSDKWYLVTGMIRSGTTITGKILSLPIDVGYIHEPFNSGFNLTDNKSFEDRYFRPQDRSQEAREYKTHLSSLFTYDFYLDNHYHHRDSFARKVAKRVIGSRGPLNLAIAKVNPLRSKSLIKDPKVIFAAESLYTNFGVCPVITVRHPLSLAASLERVGWYPTVDKFLNEPHLVDDYLSDDAELLNRSWDSPLLEAMVVWRLTYRLLINQATKYPDWHIVLHEDFCNDPIIVAKELYRSLGLSWSRVVEYRIRRLTSGGSAEASGNQVMDLKRNSANIFELRRNTIPKELRRSIFDVVEDVALPLYSRDSFALD